MPVLCGDRAGGRPSGDSVTAVCGIGVGLEKRIQGSLKEPEGEFVKGFFLEKAVQKRAGGCLSQMFECYPPGLVRGEGLFPTIDHGVCNIKSSAYFFNRHRMTKIKPEDIQDEGKRILIVRDEGIRKDGMSMATAAYDTADLQLCTDRLIPNNVNDPAFVPCEYAAGPFSPA